MNDREFTDVDRVLPVLQYLSDDKNINVSSVFPLLVLEGQKKGKKLISPSLTCHVKTEDGANVTSNTPTKRPKVPFTPACLNKEKILRVSL